jgi:hypothetical protein
MLLSGFFKSKTLEKHQVQEDRAHLFSDFFENKK